MHEKMGTHGMQALLEERGRGVCGWVDGSDPVCNQQVTRPPRHSRLSVEVKLVEALGASSKRDAVVSHAVAWHAAQQVVQFNSVQFSSVQFSSVQWARARRREEL